MCSSYTLLLNDLCLPNFLHLVISIVKLNHIVSIELNHIVCKPTDKFINSDLLVIFVGNVI